MLHKITFNVFSSSVILAFSVFVQPVYAHSLNDYESAAFLAKVPEVKVETSLIATHAGNKDAISYYENLLQRYWTAYDIKEVNERNPHLANLISSSINDTILDAKAGNGDKAYSDYFSVAGYMEQAGAIRVDPIIAGNSTIQAMAIAMVLKESLERYGDATASSEINNISSMNINNTEQTNGIVSTGTTKIVNEYAYENSKNLAKEALQMFALLITFNEDTQHNNVKIGNSMTKYIDDLQNAADPHTIVSDMYTDLYPNFVTGYKFSLESIPEFPVPSLVTIVIISMIIAITRLDLKKRWA